MGTLRVCQILTALSVTMTTFHVLFGGGGRERERAKLCREAAHVIILYAIIFKSLRWWVEREFAEEFSFSGCFPYSTAPFK